MKTLITIIFLSLLSSPSWSETQDDLVKRDGVYYKKFSDVPFSGKVTGLYKGNYKNGKEEGVWTYYYDNGQLLIKSNYENGKKEGEWISYHENGQLSHKGNHKNGKREGEWISYHENGQLSYKGNHKNGKREGEWVEFHDDGQLGNKGNYKNGVKIMEEGSVEHAKWLNGIKE